MFLVRIVVNKSVLNRFYLFCFYIDSPPVEGMGKCVVSLGFRLSVCCLRLVSLRAVNRRLYAAKSLTAKIQNERAFCKKKREFLPTILGRKILPQKWRNPLFQGVSAKVGNGRK